MSTGGVIPLCRDEFLQDFSIEVGLRFANRCLVASLDTIEQDGEPVERLSFWMWTPYDTRTCLSLCADRLAWVSVARIETEYRGGYELSFHPACPHFTAKDFAGAFGDTASLSTRFCYDESPLLTLRKIWRHRGLVETSGSLVRAMVAR